jgi:hypothetical protein
MATTQRAIPNPISSFESEPIAPKRRANLKRIKMITQPPEELPILDYLEFVKQT